MRLFITGICGFVGCRLALRFLELIPNAQISGIDNFARMGSHINLPILRAAGVHVVHGDVRMAADLDFVSAMDWIVDAAALPSVLAGIDGKNSARQLVDHNLGGTLNLLELARIHRANLALISTSRVYSVEALCKIPIMPESARFALRRSPCPQGVTEAGIDESFPTQAPVSLYGATKLASEVMALEYANAFDLRVLVNRCGVMAGAGQFGTAEQGIFSYWLRAYAMRTPLSYIGFDGMGRQVRDALHPDDLADLLVAQIRADVKSGIWNVGGGSAQSMSLAELSAWCAKRFGPHDIQQDLRPRSYDAPWIVMNADKAAHQFNWRPRRSLESILEEIAAHHRQNPDWLSVTGGI